MRRRRFLVAGLAVCLLLAGVVSGFAATTPDGLEHTAQRGCVLDDDGGIVDGTCMAQGEQEHALGDSPLADYGLRGLDNELLATGLSGVLGVLLTLAVGAGLFRILRRRPQSATSAGTTTVDASPAAAPDPTDRPAATPPAGGPAVDDPPGR